jgi:hypothetical protein
MQVLDDPVSGPSVQPERTPSVKLDIPDQAIREASKFLEEIIHLDHPDVLILNALWQVVHTTLSPYPKIRGSIANQEEFHSNIKRQGEKDFLELVKNSARRNSWSDLLHNGIFPSLTTSSFFSYNLFRRVCETNIGGSIKIATHTLIESVGEGCAYT